MRDDTSGNAVQAHLQRLLAAQQQAAQADPCPTSATRKQRLQAIKRQLVRYQDAIAQALDQDFGGRPPAVSKMIDVLPMLLQIHHAVRRLSRWMKLQRRRTEILFLTNRVEVRYQPKGVVGIISTWNGPLCVSIGPLVAALAAGNRAMIMMPPLTPATNAVVKRILGEIFEEDLVAVIGEGTGEEIGDPSQFTALPFDHLVFTGSPAIGRIVMRQAADNLTPVTLELGGKSPALLLDDYDIAEAARRIVHGRTFNGGQICVAPDYVLVPRKHESAFVAAAARHFTSMYGASVEGNPDYTAVVSVRHAARVRALLEDARAKGAAITAPAAGAPDSKHIALHIVTGCTPDMSVLQEEIFGPVLPVIPYDSVEEAIAFIHARPRPLALYCFSHDARAREDVLLRTRSGGVTINDWGWHAFNHDAPFGGTGNSGMGSYHGVEGFRELSHARTVFKRHRYFPVDLLYPPYGKLVQRLAFRLFLGRADPTVKIKT